MSECNCSCGKNCACAGKKPFKWDFPSQRQIQVRHVIFESFKGHIDRNFILSIINYIGRDIQGVYRHYPPKPSSPTEGKNVCKICMDEIPKGKRAIIWC